MTSTTPGAPPGQPPRDLPGRLFRALYSEFELRTLGSVHVAVPKGTPWYAGPSLSELARQISSGPRPDQGTDPGDGHCHPQAGAHD